MSRFVHDRYNYQASKNSQYLYADISPEDWEDLLIERSLETIQEMHIHFNPFWNSSIQDTSMHDLVLRLNTAGRINIRYIYTYNEDQFRGSYRYSRGIRVVYQHSTNGTQYSEDDWSLQHEGDVFLRTLAPLKDPIWKDWNLAKNPWSVVLGENGSIHYLHDTSGAIRRTRPRDVILTAKQKYQDQLAMYTQHVTNLDYIGRMKARQRAFGVNKFKKC